MRIMPVMPNYANTNANRNIQKSNNAGQTAGTSFQGGMGCDDLERVLKMIAAKNTEIFENYDYKTLVGTMGSLAEKYVKMGLFNKLAIHIVPGEDLYKLLGDNYFKYNVQGKFAACVAVGDSSEPIQAWGKIYEAKTLLIPYARGQEFMADLAKHA